MLFTLIASIAIQGIRQADLRFGEKLWWWDWFNKVLCYSVLKASGIKTIGVDINDYQVAKASYWF